MVKGQGVKFAPLPVIYVIAHLTIQIGNCFLEAFADHFFNPFHFRGIGVVEPGGPARGHQAAQGVKDNKAVFYVLLIELIAQSFFKTIFYHFVYGSMKNRGGDAVGAGHKIPLLKNREGLFLISDNFLSDNAFTICGAHSWARTI